MSDGDNLYQQISHMNFYASSSLITFELDKVRAKVPPGSSRQKVIFLGCFKENVDKKEDTIQRVYVKYHLSNDKIQKEREILQYLYSCDSKKFMKVYPARVEEMNYLVVDKFGKNLEMYLRTATEKSHRLQIARRLVIALHDLHSCGIVHGNINPRNIIIDMDHGRGVKFCGFGNAIDLRSCKDKATTSKYVMDSNTVFMNGYMCPEIYFMQEKNKKTIGNNENNGNNVICNATTFNNSNNNNNDNKNLFSFLLPPSDWDMFALYETDKGKEEREREKDKGKQEKNAISICNVRKLDVFPMGLLLALLLDECCGYGDYSPILTDAENAMKSQVTLTSLIRCRDYDCYRNQVCNMCLLEGFQEDALSSIVESLSKETISHCKALIAEVEKNADISTQLVNIQNGINNITDKMDSLLMRVNTQIRIISSSQFSNNLNLPLLFLILPESPARVYMHPKSCLKNLFTMKYRIYFICEHTLQIVPCGPEGKGYKLRKLKKWFQQVAPVIYFSLCVAKIALSCVGLPMPIPGMALLYNAMMTSNAFSDTSATPSGKTSGKSSAIETTAKTTNLTIDQAKELKIVESFCVEENKSVYIILKKMMQELDPHLEFCGLVRKTNQYTGVTKWVQNNASVIESFLNSKYI